MSNVLESSICILQIVNCTLQQFSAPLNTNDGPLHNLNAFHIWTPSWYL